MRNEVTLKIVEAILPQINKEDIKAIKDKIFIVLSEYEVQSRCTDIAIIDTSTNEFLIQKFMIAKMAAGRSDRTMKHYRSTLNSILNKINKSIPEITADDIRLYMALRERRDGISRVTVLNEWRVLSSFYTWAVNEEIIVKNPMAKVDAPKKQKTKKQAFTEIEVENMRNALTNNRDKCIFEMLLSTGCRVSELAQARLDEIEDDKILVHGKGAKDRIVYLNAKALLILKLYLAERKDDNPYLFPKMISVLKIKKPGVSHKEMKEWYTNPANVDSGHMDKSSIECVIRKLGRKCGVKAHPHKFRRTCATWALKHGMPIEQVSKMLGHEDIGTTQIYLDLGEEELHQAHKKYVF